MLCYNCWGSGLVHLIHEVMNFLLFRLCICFWVCITALGTLHVYCWPLFFFFPLVSGLSNLLPVLIQVLMSLKINNTKVVPCQSRADQWPRSSMFQLTGAQVILTSTLQFSASKGANPLPGILTSGNSLLITLSAVPALNFLLRLECSFSSGQATFLLPFFPSSELSVRSAALLWCSVQGHSADSPVYLMGTEIILGK